MERLLVTGGAGFIGSNFVHHLVDHTDADGHGARQADLRRHAGSPSRACPRTGSSWSSATSPTRTSSTRWSPAHDAVVHYAAESHNDNSLDDPSPFIQTNILGTFTILEAVRKHDVRLHHVSTDEVYGDLDARRPEALHRGHAVQPVQPLLRVQGRLRPPGPRVGAQLRRAGDDLQLLQQLRPLAAHREVHPAPDHQRDRRRPPEALRRRAQRPRLDPRRRPLLAPCWTILEQGRDRRDLPDRRRRREEQPRGRPADPQADFGRPEDDFDHVTDRAGHDRRYAIESGKLRQELGWQPRSRTSRPGWPTPSSGTRRTRTGGGPHKDATEAAYAAKGQ